MFRLLYIRLQGRCPGDGVRRTLDLPPWRDYCQRGGSTGDRSAGSCGGRRGIDVRCVETWCNPSIQDPYDMVDSGAAAEEPFPEDRSAV
jgi:hypothetical protein